MARIANVYDSTGILSLCSILAPALYGRSLLWIIASLSLLGCGRVELIREAGKQARETKAMSLLKQYQVAQTIYRIEGLDPEQKYAHLAELFGERLVDEQIFRAWDGQSDPEPASGYLFAEIDADRHRRAGLCAYPGQPGRDRDLMILMLLDHSQRDGWNFYVIPFEEIGRPVRRWPSSSLLGRFQKIGKLSPKEGLRRARELFQGHMTRKQ